MFAGESLHNIQNHLSGDPEELLVCMAREMASIGSFSFGQSAMVLAPEHANIIAKSGWDKQAVKQFLFEHAIQSVADLKRYGKLPKDFEYFYQREDARKILARSGSSDEDISKLIEIAKRDESRQGGDETWMISRGLTPDDILLVVAGGAAGGHSSFIPSWSRARASIFQTKPIERPMRTLPMV